jgi:hypothetical protein
MSSFMELCLVKDIDRSKIHIDDFVEEWHKSDSKLPLHKYLGLTEKEYKLWVEHPEMLEAIIDARLNEYK